MGQPTEIVVAVDNIEYSRYEHGMDTISATVQVSGGATYSSEAVKVELIKARRDRTAVVASDILSFSGTADPEQQLSTFYLPDLVDADLINLVRHGKYFVRARSLAKAASAVVGTGTATPITITAVDPGTAGNAYTVQVFAPGGSSALSITLVGTVLQINLAVAGGVPITSQNLREIIVAYIVQHFPLDLTASYTGSAGLALSVAEGPTTFTGGRDEVVGESADFDIRIVTISRMKRDYLFGLPLEATEIRMVKYPPTNITGLTVAEISRNHNFGAFTLSYNYHTDGLTNATVAIGAGANGVVTTTAVGANEGSAGNAWAIRVLVPAGNHPLNVVAAANVLTVNLAVTGGAPTGGANTATLIAAAISAVTGFSAVASGSGVTEITTASGPTSFTGGTDRIIRQISWNGGPSVSIMNAGTYLLRAGGSLPSRMLIANGLVQNYIVVRVGTLSLLPTSNAVDDLLVDRLKIDDNALSDYLEQATEYIEDVALAIYVEPTNVVTDRDPTMIQFAAGINAPNPIFTNPDFDYIAGPLTYFPKNAGGVWVEVQFPHPQMLRVDSLFGAIANTRVIDIDLDWIQFFPQGGLVQLVPFNQTIAFDFLGLIWVNAINGAAALPNFWHYNIIAGLRDCPPVIQELIGKYAAMNALIALGQAIRPGMGSTSLGRDGVSQSVSYTSQAKYGLYTGPITALKEWIDSNLPMLKGKYRGPYMVVV